MRKKSILYACGGKFFRYDYEKFTLECVALKTLDQEFELMQPFVLESKELDKEHWKRNRMYFIKKFSEEIEGACS